MQHSVSGRERRERKMAEKAVSLKSVKELMEVQERSFKSFVQMLMDNFTSRIERLDFEFDLIGISETKIKNGNEPLLNVHLNGYNFEFVPTPLVCGGVGLYIKDNLKYSILEQKSTCAFQALWIEIHLPKKKNNICGIIYRQHNSPESFLEYFNEALDKLTSRNHPTYILGDFNTNLLNSETSNFAYDFLTLLQSYFFAPTIDKPTTCFIHKFT